MPEAGRDGPHTLAATRLQISFPRHRIIQAAPYVDGVRPQEYIITHSLSSATEQEASQR